MTDFLIKDKSFYRPKLFPIIFAVIMLILGIYSSNGTHTCEDLPASLGHEAVDAATMQKVANWSDAERIQGCCAIQAGNIRLIDNIRIK